MEKGIEIILDLLQKEGKKNSKKGGKKWDRGRGRGINKIYF